MCCAVLCALTGGGGIKPCVSSFGGDQFKETSARERCVCVCVCVVHIAMGGEGPLSVRATGEQQQPQRGDADGDVCCVEQRQHVMKLQHRQ